MEPEGLTRKKQSSLDSYLDVVNMFNTNQQVAETLLTARLRVGSDTWQRS